MLGGENGAVRAGDGASAGNRVGIRGEGTGARKRLASATLGGHLEHKSRKDAHGPSIKTDEADRLARELARLTGETMTRAVTAALSERLEEARERLGGPMPICRTGSRRSPIGWVAITTLIRSPGPSLGLGRRRRRGQAPIVIVVQLVGGRGDDARRARGWSPGGSPRAGAAGGTIDVGGELCGSGDRARGTPRDASARAIEDLDAFLALAGVDLAPVDGEQARPALDARIRFGREFGASAALNFGDCFAYALAKNSTGAAAVHRRRLRGHRRRLRHAPCRGLTVLPCAQDAQTARACTKSRGNRTRSTTIQKSRRRVHRHLYLETSFLDGGREACVASWSELAMASKSDATA